MSFVELPIMRGFQEIAVLWPLAEKHQSVICGGYARYCASQNRYPITAGDVDLFPKTIDSSNNLIAELQSLGLKIKHENEISVTFHPCTEHTDPRWRVTPTVQVIKPMKEGSIVTLGSMEEILSNFDFTVVRVGLLSPTTVLADEDFLRDDETSKLVLKNIHCPISSTLRCIKYSKKGYWLGLAETVKLFIDWNERGTEYQLDLLDKLSKLKNEDGSQPSQQDIDELEKLLNVD